MNVVLANQWYPPESGWGGVAMWNYAMAHAYRGLGHQVTVIASRATLDTPAEREIDGIQVRRLLIRDAYRWRRLPGIGRYVRPAQQLAYAWRVDRLLRELQRREPLDVVEFADVNAEGFFYVRNPLTPVVVRCHTPTFVLKRYYDAREMPYDTRITSWCEKDMIHRAHALTAPSHDMARVIADECRVPPEEIAVIPNALPCDGWRVTSDEDSPVTPSPHYPVTILHVGRLERAKGVTVLADAIPLVLRAIPNAHFVFVGDDRPTTRGTSQRSELETQLGDAGVRANVEFAGAVDQAALIGWYCRADICVVPSLLYESFSYTCAQAMAAGKPVVASRIGGIPETVDDGASGLIVEPGSVEQLADAIVRLARDPVLREKMGDAGRETAAREFDPIKVAQRNLEVYERAIQTFKRLNVLLVVSSYLPNRGGLQTVTSQLARDLQRCGHPVEVLAQRYPRSLPAAEVIDGVRVRRLLFLTPRLRDLFRGRLDLFLAGLFYFPATLLRLLWRIARDKPAVVNLHFIGAPAIFLLIARTLMRFRFVVSLHGDDVESLPRGTWFDRWVFRATLRRADAVTACSRYLLNRALAIEPGVASKARVIYNGTELSDLSPGPFSSREGEQEVRLLSVGRMVPKKGFDLLLKAFALVVPDNPCARLTLIGDGQARDSLQRLAENLSLDGKVEWCGAQNHANVMQAISTSHLLVIPSREEPFGMVALEAMAAGKPVVATSVGGLPEVLVGADAVLVDPENPFSLAQAIDQTLARLEREPEFGARNRAMVRRFSPTRMVDEYERVLLAAKPG